MATQLEQSFADICAEHDLSCLSVNFHAGAIHVDARFTVYVHRPDSPCGSSSGNSIGEAIGNAIADLNAKPIALADEPLLVEA